METTHLEQRIISQNLHLLPKALDFINSAPPALILNEAITNHNAFQRFWKGIHHTIMRPDIPFFGLLSFVFNAGIRCGIHMAHEEITRQDLDDRGLEKLGVNRKIV